MQELSSVNTRHYLPGGAHDQEGIICQVIKLIYALVLSDVCNKREYIVFWGAFSIHYY